MAEKALDALAIVKASGPSSESPPSPDLPPAAAGALAEVPLTAPERKLLQILYALPPDKALMGEELTAKGLPAQSDLTSRLIGSAANGKGLRGKGWNIPNRARVGYYLSEQDRARYERMQQMARNSAGT